jgi:hypothetical protein
MNAPFEVRSWCQERRQRRCPRRFPEQTGDVLMPEGLDPIQTGKKLHEHGEAQETEKKDGDGEAEGRHSRIVQIGEAVLLALVTITAA